MKPVNQLIFGYSPEMGLFGDCLRACVASIFDKPSSEVPHFADLTRFPAGHEKALRDWLRPQGFSVLYIGVPAADYEQTCQNLAAYGMDAYHLLGGEVRGQKHVVVAQFGICVHDPGLSFVGLAPDSETNTYEFGFFVKGGW